MLSDPVYPAYRHKILIFYVHIYLNSLKHNSLHHMTIEHMHS